MVTTQKRLRRTVAKLSVAAFAFASFGAAVVAAPYVVSKNLQVAKTQIGQLQSLGNGPSIMLAKAPGVAGEDCVRVTRMTGPDGKVYPTNGLVCGGN